MSNVFTSYDELFKFFEEHKISLKDVSFDVLPAASAEPVIEIKTEIETKPVLESVDIKLDTLSDSPILSAKLGDANIIYVDECVAEKNACSTTKIKFLERELWINVCDCDNETTINLNVVLGEKILYNVPFIVKENNNQKFSIEINKDILNET